MMEDKNIDWKNLCAKIGEAKEKADRISGQFPLSNHAFILTREELYLLHDIIVLFKDSKIYAKEYAVNTELFKFVAVNQERLFEEFARDFGYRLGRELKQYITDITDDEDKLAGRKCYSLCAKVMPLTYGLAQSLQEEEE